MLANGTRVRPHQNEKFPDVDYLIEAGEKKSGRVVHVPDSSSPLLKAIARRLMRSRNQAAQQDVLHEANQLRDFLIKTKKEQKRKVFVFASPGKNEGASSIILNLAKAFEVQGGARVLIIDANLRTPGLTRFLGGMAMSYGLLDLMAGDSTVRGVLQKLAGAEIYFLSHGRKRRQLADYITMRRQQEILARFESLFDYIILDAPPLAVCNDGFLWGALARGLILILNTRDTRLDAIQKVTQTAKSFGTPVLGTVLNKRNFDIPRFAYEWI